MSLLWNFYNHPEAGLPNTNNALEGLFSYFMINVAVHSLISKEYRTKLLDGYIKDITNQWHRRRNIRPPATTDKCCGRFGPRAVLALDCCLSITRNVQVTEKSLVLSGSLFKICFNRGKMGGFCFLRLKSRSIFSVRDVLHRSRLSTPSQLFKKITSRIASSGCHGLFRHSDRIQLVR